jgi:hypothetical protein
MVMSQNAAPLTLAILLLFAAGCAKVPAERLAAAEKALADARASGAAQYLPEDLAKLNGLLMEGKREILNQEEKWPLFRDYETAEYLLATLLAETPKVIAESTRRKEAAREAAETALQGAEQTFAHARTLLAHLRLSRGQSINGALTAEVQTVAAFMIDARAAMDVGDYAGAQAKARAIQDQCQTLVSEIQVAQARTARAPGRSPASTKKP